MAHRPPANSGIDERHAKLDDVFHFPIGKAFARPIIQDRFPVGLPRAFGRRTDIGLIHQIAGDSRRSAKTHAWRSGLAARG